MANTTMKAFVVGTKYYNVSMGEATRLLAGGGELKRDRNNKFDSHAIAVIASGRMLGHINREAAEIIAPLIDKGAQYSLGIDTARHNSAASIPVIIRLSAILEDAKPDFLCASGVIGIYCITVGSRFYVGQSTDIRDRILTHWTQLRWGAHTNPELRELWQSEGGASFRVKVLETAPNGLVGLALARWLVDHERSWLDRLGGLKNAINAEQPTIVLNDVSRSELERERRRYAPQVQALTNELDILNQTIHGLSERDKELKRTIKDLSRFWSMLLSSEKRQSLAQANSDLTTVRRNKSLACQKRSVAEGALQELHRALYLT